MGVFFQKNVLSSFLVDIAFHRKFTSYIVGFLVISGKQS